MSLLLIIAIAIVNPFSSNAQIKKNFLQRTSQYSPTKKIYNVKGDFTMLGNTNLTLQNYNTATNNNNQNMVYVDIDGDNNTWNSSSATLELSQENGAISSCSNIIFAGLYWTGKSSADQIFTASKPGPIGTVSVNNNLNVSHNKNIESKATPNYATNFALSVTAAGIINNIYPIYSFNGNGNTYAFKFYNSGVVNRVTLSVNGQAEQNIPVTLNGLETEAVLSTPYTITDGTLIIKIKKLTRLSGTNESSVDIQNSSIAEVNVTGNYTGPININKTFNKRIVSLKGPNSSNYTPITADANDIYYPSGSEDDIYSAFAEITDFVKNNGIGKYTVADLALLEGNPGGTGYSGGWGMIVVYENAKMKWRDITLFDGYAYVQSANKLGYNLPVSGFNSVQSGAVGIKLGMIASEGDVSFTDDYFKIQNLNTTNYTDLNHSKNTTTNFFNSSINVVGARFPSLENNTGIDVAILDIPNTNNSIIQNNQNSTNFRYGTNGDTYSIFAIALAIDAYVPEVEAIVSLTKIDNTPVSTAPYSVLPGKILEYKVDIKNLGTEAIKDGKLIIPIPYNATYVPNSAVGTIYFSPSPNPNYVTYNPSLGATGSIVWDLASLPYTATPNKLLATLTFKLKATTDCRLLTNSSCGTSINLLGNFSGTGANTQIPTTNNKLIQGYQQNGICANQPITNPLSVNIDSANYIALNCKGINPIQLFPICTLNTTIPITEITSGFPVGSLFYNEFPVTSNTIQYTINKPFPATPGITTYYAVAPGSLGCFFEFQINVTTITSTPTTDGNVTYCKGATAQPLTATASNPAYTLYYYTSLNGAPELSITPSTAVVGQTSYYVAEATSGTCVGPKVEIIVTILEPEVKPVLACYQTATLNPNTCKWDIIGTQPVQPALTCYQIATFNDTTCQWDISGSIPEEPTMQCYEIATFNDLTCSWDITGTKPEMPVVTCYDKAIFDTEICAWFVIDNRPPAPAVACYQTAEFNTITCTWDVTGIQPAKPALLCYQTATFNNATCTWVITGIKPNKPRGLACYQTATFNETTCIWDVTGTQPVKPTLECYQTATFNSTTCVWDITGIQPVKPTVFCYQTAIFNPTTCVWDVTGTQPAKPTLECYQTATFNNATCVWDITGTQPVKPTVLCYQTATFNTTTCVWDVAGTQPAKPTLECYQTATFNNATCVWDITGIQPLKPIVLCYQTATFNTTTCVWDVTGSQPAKPTIECYQTATFNNTTCVWDITGTQPIKPNVLCYQTATFNSTTCAWDVTGTQTAAPIIGTITQPTCGIATGSFTIANYNTEITYIVTPNEGVTITGNLITAPEGSYTVIASINGCNSETSATITINTQPKNTETEGLPGVAKCNEDKDLTVNLTILLPQGTATDGKWINVNNVGELILKDGIEYFKPFGVAIGNYTFKYETLRGDCTDTVIIDMKVNNDCAILPCGDIQYIPGYAKCNEDATLEVNLTILLPEGTPTGGKWSNVNNVGELILKDGIEYFKPFGVAVGTYVFQYDFLNGNCIKTIIVNMQVDDDCAVLPCGDVQNIPGYAKCNDDTELEINLTALLPEGTLTGGIWTNVNGAGELVTKDGIEYFKPFGVAVGNYTFKYEVLNVNCLQTVNINMQVDNDCILPCEEVQGKPGYAKCNADVDVEVPISELIPTDILKGGVWTNNDVGELITRGSITYFKPYGVATGFYPFVYTVENGACADIVNVTMQVDDKCSTLPEGGCALVVHNAFSPNGDGVNDHFQIDNIEIRDCFPSVKVEVYNRWGVLVFESNDYNNADRAFKGISEGRTTVNKNEGLPSGTYFYIIQYTTSEGKTENKDGYLYLSK